MELPTNTVVMLIVLLVLVAVLLVLLSRYGNNFIEFVDNKIGAAANN